MNVLFGTVEGGSPVGWAVALDFLGLVVADGSALSCMHAGGLASWCGHPFAIVSIGDSLGAIMDHRL